MQTELMPETSDWLLAPAAPVVHEAPNAASAPTLATGSPSPEVASALFGGLFDDGVGREVAKKAMAENEAKQRAAIEAARAQLGDRLEIGGAGPNGVSEEEYERMVDLHAKIALGQTDIQFDAGGMKRDKAAQLKELAMNDMATMMQTQAGRELLGEMACNTDNESGEHHKTTIQFMRDVKDAHCTRPASEELGWDIENRDHDGRGNDAIVQYAPGQGFVAAGTDGYEVAHRSDTILFHEMVHAYHRTHGTLAQGEVNPLSPNDIGLGNVEYQATGLVDHSLDRFTENDYRQERIDLGEELALRERYKTIDGEFNHHDE